ncbi:uncharacterized protein FTOL_01340 [Fusarium torulosum]|uniref:Uncharacterized protein n=1 Tax=Fusarium torulosum TaxID=33205 RepID=A0AAE8SDJ9_9HYPO|nr:uncharacterized protein FTOL_01340 [Fusarium torulosum]
MIRQGICGRPQDPKLYSLEIRGPNTGEHSYPLDYSSVVAESFPAATPIYQKSFYLDFKKSAERLFQYEWHALPAQRCTGFKNYLTVPVQFCSTIHQSTNVSSRSIVGISLARLRNNGDIRHSSRDSAGALTISDRSRIRNWAIVD